MVKAAGLVICAILGWVSPNWAVERGEEVHLWTHAAPGSERETEPEVFQGGTNPKLPAKYTVVHSPSVFVFLPPPERANGMAMIVAPGGGHSQLVMDKEGYQIANWLNAQGIAAFVLKYRLARAPGSNYTVPDHALADASRAMRLVRSRAGEWHIDPLRVGVIGFSAGGEVAALLETRFSRGQDGATDPVEQMSSRPDFAVLVYPGFRPGTVTVPRDAPSTFLVCANDDPSHVITTVNFYLDLEKQGVSSELHIYAAGGHGFALREKTKPVASWPDRPREWLIDRKLLQNQ